MNMHENAHMLSDKNEHTDKNKKNIKASRNRAFSVLKPLHIYLCSLLFILGLAIHGDDKRIYIIAHSYYTKLFKQVVSISSA